MPFVEREVARLGPEVPVLGTDDTSLRLDAGPDAWSALLSSRLAVAAHAVLVFDVARPRTLRSPEHVRRVAEAIAGVRALHPKKAFRGVRISAAGQESEDYERLVSSIAEATGLAPDPDDGELLLRFRRSRFAAHGWDVLVRLSPRPLSTRPWRVWNYPGAVNATIAAAMIELSSPSPTDRFLNLMSGSGTILIERITRLPVAAAVGVELDPDVVQGAKANLRAARLRVPVELIVGDATALTGVADASFDSLAADLPWGTLVGSHDDNAELYPRVLTEAARVATPDARFVVLTHELRLFERVLAAQQAWRLTAEHRVFQKGHHPRIYVLHRT